MNAPLAERMRPKNIDEMVGQTHLLGEGCALLAIVKSGIIPNLIFYGPSGVGKTTLASIIAEQTDKLLCKLNGTTAGTADVKHIVAQRDTLAGRNGVLLYLDEIQYFNKKQQQSLLEVIEDGSVTLIASTTENPFFYIYNAILSRSTVFEFKAIEDSEILKTVNRGFEFLKNERSADILLEDGGALHISKTCGGDVRKALNAVELCVTASPVDKNGVIHVSLDTAKQLSQKSAMRYDREGDEHYDIISAYQKSMRGSDADAALHYLARLLNAGDLLSACRRLLVCACEDVGLAYPQIIPIVKAAVDTAIQIGLPEARIPLANAVIMVCSSPKSNSAYFAIDEATSDIEAGNSGPIPRSLQNKHFDGKDKDIPGQFYLYPHNYENAWVDQQYLPDVIAHKKYYIPGNNKNEKAFNDYWKKIKKQEKSDG